MYGAHWRDGMEQVFMSPWMIVRVASFCLCAWWRLLLLIICACLSDRLVDCGFTKCDDIQRDHSHLLCYCVICVLCSFSIDILCYDVLNL